jgi:hypothetical protein
MMMICINNEIIAPLKCGTRYLRSLGLSQYSIYANDTDWHRVYETNWKFIILRNPLDHLKSALQTELLNLYNGHSLWNGMTTESVLDRFISEDGCDHWSGNMYKMIYDLWILQNKQSKIINLNDMSYFISNMGYYIPFIEKRYNFSKFKIWMSKNDIFKMIEEKYNTHYIELINLNNSDIYYYNQLNFEKVTKNLL